MTKVSIIVPVYNAEKYLSATLDSALKQTFKDIEIVCVNDGSTDGSLDILQDYQASDGRIKIITQSNAGGSAARNVGVAESIGDYIMFLDSDDIYTEDIVELAYNRAIESKSDIVFYNFARFTGRPTKLAVVNKLTPKDDITFFTKEMYEDKFFNDLAIITWNKLIKKSVIEANGLSFDTKLSHNHDVDFSVRLMLAAKSYSWLGVVGYYYRSNESGLTATKRSDPTNVLKILMNLNKQITASYAYLKPSFNNYVVDMVVGTILKYRNDVDKVKQVTQYSHDVVIAEAGLSSKNSKYANSLEIFKMVEAAEYEKVVAYINNPKQKTRVFLRNLYDGAQGVLARFTV